jgi:hypothetical protein
MPTLGDTLRSMRMEKGFDLVDAAESTRIKFQILEDMENDDFSRMPSPVYVKGFIKMYAKFLGVDTQPLLQQYDLQTQPGGKKSDERDRSITMEPVDELGRGYSVLDPIKDVLRSIDWGKVKGCLGHISTPEQISKLKRSFVEEPLRCVVAALGIFIVVFFLLSMLTRCSREAELSATPAQSRHDAALVCVAAAMQPACHARLFVRGDTT